MNVTPGTVLPNGRIVIACRESGKKAGQYVVLALADNPSHPHPYATWMMNPGYLDTYWGDYFTAAQFTEAVASYEER